MVCGDGYFKPSLLIFDISSGKKQSHLSEKQPLYEILVAPEFAEEALKLRLACDRLGHSGNDGLSTLFGSTLPYGDRIRDTYRCFYGIVKC